MPPSEGRAGAPRLSRLLHGESQQLGASRAGEQDHEGIDRAASRAQRGRHPREVQPAATLGPGETPRRGGRRAGEAGLGEDPAAAIHATGQDSRVRQSLVPLTALLGAERGSAG